MHLQAKARTGNEDALIPRTAAQIADGMQEGYHHIGIFDEDRLIAHAGISSDNADSTDPLDRIHFSFQR